MTKINKLVSKVIIIHMYHSFIYPYLTYGSILCGNNYYSPIYDVVKLQSKAIRVINDAPIIGKYYSSLCQSRHFEISRHC